MASVTSATKRCLVALYSWTLLFNAQFLTPAVTGLQTIWSLNRSSIMVLTGVNVAITASTELVARTVSAPATVDPEENAFFVKDDIGNYSINRQSLINIWMTFFASMLGGVVFFMETRFKRFLFFVAFGTFNSFISQMISGIIKDGVLAVTVGRLWFDFFYNGSVKYCIFEIGRRTVVRHSDGKKFMNLGFFRLGQDLATTFARVSLLNLFGFRG